MPQFYARYVPTKIPADVSNPEGTLPTSKRRKKNDQGFNDVGALSDIHLNETFDFSENRPSADTPNHSGVSKAKNHLESKAGADLRSIKAGTLALQGSNLTTTVERELSRKNERDPTTSLKGPGQIPNVEIGDDQVQTLAEVVKKQKKPKRGKDTPNRNDLETVANGQTAEGSKHTSILSKYQKSIKATTKAAENDSDKQDKQQAVTISPETHGLQPIPQPQQVLDATPASSLSALPAWLANPTFAAEAESIPFHTLPLNPSVQESLKAKGFTEAFTIQAAVLPLLLPSVRQHHGDLCISAHTGSGKTLAYTLPMVEALRDKPIRRLRGLIVVPTKDLVNQVYEVLGLCSSGSGLKNGMACGSHTLQEEAEALVFRQQRYDPEAYLHQQSKEVDEDEELLNWDTSLFEGTGFEEEGLVDYIDDYASSIDILVCTPGRLVEHLRHTRGFTLDHIQWLVVDEADRLLDDSFQQWIDVVVPALEHQIQPSTMENLTMERFHLLRKREIRKVILSATMTRDISKLKELKLRRPKLVVLRAEQEPKLLEGNDEEQATPSYGDAPIELPPKLQEFAIQVKDEEHKPLYLLELLKHFFLPDSRSSSLPVPENPRDRQGGNTSNETDMESVTSESISSSSSESPLPSLSGSSPNTSSDASRSDFQCERSQGEAHGCLVFVRSTSSAHRLSRLLSILSPKQALLTVTLTKSSLKSSKEILSRFQNGRLNTIISTDRASRGLDMTNLAHVINYDMPPSVNSYIHRVGRTARAGKPGKATTLVGWREGRWFWNEIGKGQGIHRGKGKITRQVWRDRGWNDEERQRYSEALRQLGEETRQEQI
ncbi:MAG: hypothetical protein Q9219_002481 [cf. Caloplaca sp. 3 TL-2023]